MKNPGRVALYLRAIADEITETTSEMVESETTYTLDAISAKLRDLSEAIENADGDEIDRTRVLRAPGARLITGENTDD